MSTDLLGLVTALRRDTPEDEGIGTDSDSTASSGGRLTFETVLSLFHKKIYNLAYRLLGNSDEAADLTQETFVSAYKAYPKFRGGSEAVYAWLCQIAVNGCKNKFREMNRRNRYEVLSLDEPIVTDESNVELEVGDESMNPAGVFERREMEAKVQESIQALPPEFRVVVVLRDMHGLSYREIADATGLTVDVVKVRLFRGRGAIRRRLSQYIKE